jgi:Mrp family chromosome partitioning ATPase
VKFFSQLFRNHPKRQSDSVITAGYPSHEEDLGENDQAAASDEARSIDKSGPFRKGHGLREAYARQIKEILASLIDNRSLVKTPQNIVVGSIDCDQAVTKITESLAIACATNGLKVLIVDANFEAPRLHEDFGQENDVGVTTFLCSSEPPHRLIKRTEFASLDLLASGPSFPEMSSRLARQQLLHRLQPVAKRYDFLFIDAGSLQPYHLANVGLGCDNLVIAVREHAASMRELERMCSFLRGEKVPDPSILIVE